MGHIKTTNDNNTTPIFMGLNKTTTKNMAAARKDN
jgi:hypothetical protein